jgi:hypothetical protein
VFNSRHHPTGDENDQEGHHFILERRCRVSGCSSHQDRTGNDGDIDREENGKTPAGTNAAWANENDGWELSRTSFLRDYFRRKLGQGFDCRWPR